MEIKIPPISRLLDLSDFPHSYVGFGTNALKVNSGETGIEFSASGGGGTGTVESVSVTTANGVSGSVLNPTTTPAITLTLGAITPTSVAAVGSVTGSNLSGTNTGDQTSIVGITGTLAQFNTAVTDAELARTDAAQTFTGAQTFLTPIEASSIATMTATVGGAVPTPPNNTTTFLRGDGTFAAPSGGGGSVSLTEVEIDFGTISSPNTSWTITDASIDPSKKILVFPSPNPATGRLGNDWELDIVLLSGTAGTGNFVLSAIPTTRMVGARKVYYQVV